MVHYVVFTVPIRGRNQIQKFVDERTLKVNIINARGKSKSLRLRFFFEKGRLKSDAIADPIWRVGPLLA
jgi:hypothetical protein